MAQNVLMIDHERTLRYYGIVLVIIILINVRD